VAYSNACSGSNGCYTKYQWECVEYAERYYGLHLNTTISSVGSAVGAFSILKSDKRFEVHPQGDHSIPQADDLVVFDKTTDNPFGHIAVAKSDPVLQADGTYRIPIIEQNVYLTHELVMQGDSTVGFNITGRTNISNSAMVLGWIRLVGSTKKMTGTLAISATLDANTQISGALNYTITDSRGHSISNASTVPLMVPDLLTDTYTITYNSGGPPKSTLSSISPCTITSPPSPVCKQTLTTGQTVAFNMQFKSNPPTAGFVWPVSGHDPQRTSLANYVGPDQIPNGRAPRWSYASGTAIVGDMVVSAEGTLYFASDKLYALTPSGTLYTSPVTFDRGVPLSSPAVDDTNGFVYVVVSSPNPTNNPNLRAYDVVQLSKQLTDQTTVYHSPYPYSNPNIVPHGLMIGTDGTVYFTDGATVVARGGHSWTMGTPNTGPCFGNPGFLTPTLGSDGNIFVACQAYAGNAFGAGLYKFDAATGAQLKYTPYPYMRVEFMFDAQNRLRAGDSSTFGANSTGHYDAWDTNLALVSDVSNDDTSSRSSLMPDGSSTVRIGKSTLVDPTNTFFYDLNYQGAQTNTLSARGAQSWDIRGGTGGSTAFFSTVPSVDSAGNIFVGTVAGIESRSGIDGNLIWAFATGDTVTTQPVIAGPGVLYVGTSTGKIYAF